MKLKKIILDIPDIRYLHPVIFFLRLCSGGFLLTHGIPKLSRLMAGGEIKFADPLGFGEFTSFILCIFAEVFCSFFIIIGLGTRLAAIPLIINMSVISFIVHGPDPFAKKELALFYLLIFATLFILGGGKYSIDYLMGNRKLKNTDIV